MRSAPASQAGVLTIGNDQKSDNTLESHFRISVRCQTGLLGRGGGSEHYRTIEALMFSIDPQKKIISTLDILHRKRNIGSYDDIGFEALNIPAVEPCCE